MIVLAATNRPDLVDPSVVRGGRFGETVHVPLPGAGDRARLLLHFGAAMRWAKSDVDTASLAARTAGYSGADLRYADQREVLD